MINEYHRPDTIEETLRLIARPDPRTLPLGGGTVLNHSGGESLAVVDLQSLDLDTIQERGNDLEIGATATLQSLYATPHLPAALQAAIKLDTNYNLRQVATLAGALVACDGRSPLATVFLALDAKLTLQPGDEEVTLGNLLPLREELLRHRLITKITIPLQVKLAFEFVARTPADRPIVCVAIAQWPSGRTRLALGGYGKIPALAMDGTEATGLEVAARDSFHEAADEWASAEYRRDVAATLAKRCLQNLS
jgi:CO/xanthine dehydrogenase FAD-binding subunit